MTVLSYIAGQKAKIIKKHEGEVYFFGKACGQNSPVKLELRPAGEILREMDSMRGLNKKERASFPKRSAV